MSLDTMIFLLHLLFLCSKPYLHFVNYTYMLKSEINFLPYSMMMITLFLYWNHHYIQYKNVYGQIPYRLSTSITFYYTSLYIYPWDNLDSATWRIYYYTNTHNHIYDHTQDANIIDIHTHKRFIRNSNLKIILNISFRFFQYLSFLTDDWNDGMKLEVADKNLY